MRLTIKVRIVFAWYDWWIGAYWDRKGKALYLMIPMMGFALGGNHKHHCPSNQSGHNPTCRWVIGIGKWTCSSNCPVFSANGYTRVPCPDCQREEENA